MTDEQGDRLRKARMRKGLESATKAARAYGWNVSTYVSHENNSRGISRKAAERYSAALGVSVGWLLSGENPPDWALKHKIEVSNEIPVRRVPVLTIKQAYGLTQGEKPEQNGNSGDYTVVGADPMLGPKIFALKISDDAMLPEFSPGEFVVIDPGQSAKTGDFAAIALKKGELAIIRQLHQRGFDETGAEQLSLHALNEYFADTPFAEGQTGWLLGKVVLHVRKF